MRTLGSVHAQILHFPSSPIVCNRPKTPISSLSLKNPNIESHPRSFFAINRQFSGRFPAVFLPRAADSSEVPVDESFLEKFGPKDKETEEEARRRNWIERGWAPWEEILSPEADFARKSLNEGEEVPLQSPEAIEAFKMLTPAYRKKKMEQMGLTEDEYLQRQFAIKGEIPDPLTTRWSGPMVLTQIPPRDWPPRGWKVDKKELAYIREAHKLQAVRIDVDEKLKSIGKTEEACFDRYQVFLKQYKEWVAANKDRMEEESYQFDQDYHPGRRKRGKDYNDTMFELPFIYPGQICVGKVTTVHLYQGAFVDIGCVYDGWVPIKGNDWFWIRHHIKVGMRVFVEILAKRDPYRFRFPIEMRFLDPNIDHLIFNRFEFPPIFHRDEDTNPEEIWRDSGRLPVPRKRPVVKFEEQSLLSNHPYVDKRVVSKIQGSPHFNCMLSSSAKNASPFEILSGKTLDYSQGSPHINCMLLSSAENASPFEILTVWQIHVAEQTILDDEEVNPDKYRDKENAQKPPESAVDEEDSVEYTQAYYKKALLPKMILKTNVRELNMDAACAERQLNNKLRAEAKEKGEEFKITKLRRNIEMDELDLIHWRRSLEEREALIRDISCRKALGLPLEEPGRYVDDSYFGKDRYDPTSPLYRYDYWGEPKNSEKSKQERETDSHNKSIVGKGTVWYEMSYDEFVKQKMRREARSKGMKKEEEEEEGGISEFDYRILGNSTLSPSNKPVVNGTESPSMLDEGMFDN